MPHFVASARSLIALGILLILSGSVRADRIRIHYGPGGATGAEYVSRFGTSGTPYASRIRPNQVVTFVHAYTGAQVQVPIAFPIDSTPRVEHRRDRIIFNYGSSTIEVVFLPDGSVDVVYNSGFLRSSNW
jgi:hypothetical protein